MPFTSDNANVNHYPGTTKQATEDGFERFDMPDHSSDPNQNNMARLHGRIFLTEGDMTSASD